VLPETVRSKNGSFTSWELNLVLRDGKRLAVIDHGDGATVRADAERLGREIGVPVWTWPG